MIVFDVTDAGQGKSVINDANLTIPLLMKNRIPDGFETDDRLDVSLRPDEVRSTTAKTPSAFLTLYS